MKAILVIDMPEICAECKLNEERQLINGSIPVCNATGVVVCQDEIETIPSWCPLKPLPPKLDANDWHRMFSGVFSEREAKGYGWNACLKEITGE